MSSDAESAGDGTLAGFAVIAGVTVSVPEIISAITRRHRENEAMRSLPRGGKPMIFFASAVTGPAGVSTTTRRS
jgi:hypothetical protein